MYKEFEGRNEQEAIDKAISELGLDRDDFDVEILSRENLGSDPVTYVPLSDVRQGG